MPGVHNRFVSFLLRAAVVAAALLFISAFVPLLFGLRPAIITSGSMEPRLHVGDVVMINRRDHHLRVHDVITFDRHGQSVTHRIAKINEDGTIRTKGDANGSLDSEPVKPSDVTGSVVFVVPVVGIPALHPEIIALFGVLLLAQVSRSAGPALASARMSVRWSPTCDRVAMIAVLSVVATACVGTTLTGAVFTSSTSNPSNSFQARDGYYSTVLSYSPQSYWRLGEASGTTAADTMGLLDGTYTSANVTYGVTAPLSHDDNTAISCSAGTTCFGTNDAAVFHNTGSQSIALWFKPSVATQTTNARVFTKYDGTNITYFMAYNGTSGNMRYLVDVNSRVTAQSTTLITNTSNWYFMVGTWDGTTARIYINGTQEGTATGTGLVKQNTVGFMGLGNATGGAGAKGALDDVAVWNRVLTPTEISTLYTRGTT